MKRRRSQSIALVVTSALFASACGGASDGTEASDSLVGASPTTAPIVSTTALGTVSPTEAPLDAEDDGRTGTVRQMPEVLAFAFEAANNESFTFTQGLALQLGPDGVVVPASEPYASGEVDGDLLHVSVDVEKFVGESLGILRGMGPEAPVGERFEFWTDGTTLTLDLRELTLSSDAVDEASTSPVSVDLAAAPDIDSQTAVRHLGSGSVVTEPSALLNSLSILEEAEVIADETIDGVSLSGYRSRVLVADYYGAQGSSAADQLSILDAIGFEGADGDALAALIPDIERSHMDVTAYLDGEGRLRRLTTNLNLTEVVVSYLAASPALAEDVGSSSVDLDSMFGAGGLQIVVSGWQSFNDYGSPVTIVVPEAADVIGEASGLFG